MLIYGQQNTTNDSVVARLTLDRYRIKFDPNTSVNENGLQLKLQKRKIKKIARMILFEHYGWFNIMLQKPFFIYFLDDYWILQGTGKRLRRRGGFVIVINAQNGCVELLTHGK
jgi:hypothetical protein